MSSKPSVLILGITGRTGKSVADGILASGLFRLAALVRPASITRPAVQSYREKGVEIREGDIHDGVEKLKEYLRGIDIVISTVYYDLIPDQKPLFEAAKAVGVKRVIPCDFGTPGGKGVRLLHDQKLAVREFIQNLGIGYTFIDVGLWMQYTMVHPSKSTSPAKSLFYFFVGNGDKKFLVTNLDHIGTFVARIIADERTLNQYVIIWEDELTEEQARAIAEKYSGEEATLKAARIPLSEDELLKQLRAAKEAFDKDPSADNHVQLTWAEYQYSIHILGEDSLESAKKLGALDAHELYPDIPRTSFEKFAEAYYAAEGWKDI